MLHQELSQNIIRIYYQVYNELGFGFLEKVYENAMFFELNNSGFFTQKQLPIKVHYKHREVGEYYADLIVENKIILELKAAESLAEEHECQLINYLKATDIEVGLLFNFGKKPEFKRKIFTNDLKKIRDKSV
ncbi:MAG: GxxExxY protein [Chitinophagales bacterium]|jgi:GxxExxY protein|nr:GxxExxY protein [Chitinophagales bacterium]MBP6324052.1 GxxExxY protein [Chitinophagales bacterium]